MSGIDLADSLAQVVGFRSSAKLEAKLEACCYDREQTHLRSGLQQQEAATAVEALAVADDAGGVGADACGRGTESLGRGRSLETDGADHRDVRLEGRAAVLGAEPGHEAAPGRLRRERPHGVHLLWRLVGCIHADAGRAGGGEQRLARRCENKAQWSFVNLLDLDVGDDERAQAPSAMDRRVADSRALLKCSAFDEALGAPFVSRYQPEGLLTRFNPTTWSLKTGLEL